MGREGLPSAKSAARPYIHKGAPLAHSFLACSGSTSRGSEASCMHMSACIFRRIFQSALLNLQRVVFDNEFNSVSEKQEVEEINASASGCYRFLVMGCKSLECVPLYILGLAGFVALFLPRARSQEDFGTCANAVWLLQSNMRRGVKVVGTILQTEMFCQEPIQCTHPRIKFRFVFCFLKGISQNPMPVTVQEFRQGAFQSACA